MWPEQNEGEEVNSRKIQVSRSIQRLDQADFIQTMVKSLNLNINI